jgi:hypothetical protein
MPLPYLLHLFLYADHLQVQSLPWVSEADASIYVCLLFSLTSALCGWMEDVMYILLQK